MCETEMLGQARRVSFSNHNTEKSLYKDKSANEWFLSLNERLESTINTLTM